MSILEQRAADRELRRTIRLRLQGARYELQQALAESRQAHVSDLVPDSIARALIQVDSILRIDSLS